MTRRQWWLIAAIGTVFGLVVGGLQWWKYVHFGYNGLDLGIYSQTVWSLANGRGFASSIHDPSYLGDHLELWLVPISWLYRLWSSPLLLLWVQTALIASSLVPLAKLSARLLPGRAVIIVAGLFVLHPLVYNIALYEFHGLVVALPLLLWSIWWYVERRYWPWLLTLAGILLVREDLPFVVAGWGLMAAVDRRTWRWWALPIALAGLWFPAAQAVIRAANHDGVYKYLAFYRWLGTAPGEILSFPVRHPLLFIRQILSLNNLGTVVGLAVTFGFLPLLRPRRLWPLLLVLALLLIGNAQPGSYLRIHYPVPFLPFLAWATLEAYRDWRRGALFPTVDRRVFGPMMAIMVVIAPLYSSLIIGPAEWPWRGLRRDPATPAAVARRALADVAPSDRVLTTFNYLPLFANRSTLYSLNYLYLGRRQYSEIPYRLRSDIDVAVIDWQQLYEYQFLYRTTVFEGRSGPQRMRELLAAQGLGLVRQYGSVAVYRRGGSADQSAVSVEPPADASATTYGPLALLGRPSTAVVNRPEFGWRELVVDATWKALTTSPDSPVSIRYVIKRGGRTIWTQPRIVGQGSMPASEWPTGSVWQTRDVLVLPPGITGDAILSAEMFVPAGRYRLDRLRTFRPIIDRPEQLGTIELGSASL